MMNALQITPRVASVGVLHPTLRIFDAFVPAASGTSYNSFLIRGSEKIALIDGVHQNFSEIQLEKIQSVVDLTKVDYLIVQHAEPDHSGSIQKLLAAAPQIQIIATRSAGLFLKAQLNRELPLQIAADGETLSLGDRTLRFIHSPFWHWPDTLFTYLEEEQLLFSCDGFGCHYAEETMTDERSGDFWPEFVSYYTHIMRPFADKIITGCEKVRQLELKMICPSHGPVLTKDLERYIQAYEDWSRAALAKEKTVAVIYISVYGNTKKMAEIVAAAISERGVKCKLLQATKLDLLQCQAELETVQGILFGSPTINGDALAPIWNVISATPLLANRGKITAACFGSFGWSGEACGQLTERLKGLRYKLPLAPYKVNFTPTAEDESKLKEWAQAFVAAL
ncbi:MAG: FprA family A-type flavoprotein [Negativicutes bacterium]|nr:FprA family A-type flavoprotein [Negativicutes bacterium]